MDISKMKNIIVLKNLPSNIIEEAIVVVKEPKKIRKKQYADIEKNNKINNKEMNREENKEKVKKVNNENSKEYIVKEAEMIINNYITSLEAEAPKSKKNIKKIQRRYKKSLQLNAILAFATVISLVLSII